MGSQAQIDYDALAQQHGGQAASGSGVDYDSLAVAHGGSVSSAASDPNAAIRQKYNLPAGVDLTKGYFDQPEGVNVDPMTFSKAYQEANPAPPEAQGFLANMWGEAKNAVKGAFSEGTGTASAPPIPGIGLMSLAKQRVQQAKTDLPGAIGATTTDAVLAAAPLLIDKAPEIWSKVSPTASFEAALGSKLSAAEADTPRPGGQIQPALNNTPREVLQWAHDNNIQLTPGQATENALAQNAEKSGTNAAIGGKELQTAKLEQKTNFGQAINNLMDDVDPKRMGMNAESAGEAVQQAQGVAKGVSHDNASQGYQKIDYLMDKPVNPQPISAAWNQLKANLPIGAEENILAQTPRSMRAVVEDMLSGNPDGFKPTFSQAIQLRKFFRDMGDTQGLPNQTQAIFKQMSGAVDGAMQSTAGQLNATSDWRDANAGWKNYATKYGNPQSILYKIGKANDPTRIVTMLQNAPATDILTVKQELGDAALEPLRRQVIQDMAQSRFNVGHDGLGGYSDSYLKALFGPEQTKELYVAGDAANRMKYDPNPSGTAGGLQALEQLRLGNQAKMTTAAKLSMPKDALSYLQSSPSRTQITPPLQLSNPSKLNAAASSAANDIVIDRLEKQIASEKNPIEKARLQRMQNDYKSEKTGTLQ